MLRGEEVGGHWQCRAKSRSGQSLYLEMVSLCSLEAVYEVPMADHEQLIQICTAGGKT